MNAKKKLREYRIIKNSYGTSPYLKLEEYRGRGVLARLRSGTNALRAEKARGKGKIEKRCNLCKRKEEENFEHVALICPFYSEERRKIKDIIQLKGRKLKQEEGDMKLVKEIKKG